MSLATSSPVPAVLTATITGHSNPSSKNSRETALKTGNEQDSPTCRTGLKKARNGRSQVGNIILTPQLLHFLHKSPDKGQQVIAKITHRQIVSSAACAEKMRMLMYDIFMVATGDNYITHQLEKGKLHIKSPSQHKHSNGVPPKYAFMTLLLQAAIHSNTAQHQLGLHPVHDLQLTQGRMDYHSIHIHNRLIQIAEDYEQPTRTTALSFNFGQDYRHITQAILEELKRVRSLPWPIKLDEPGHLSATHPQQHPQFTNKTMNHHSSGKFPKQ